MFKSIAGAEEIAKRAIVMVSQAACKRELRPFAAVATKGP